jgi:drug/metabolite transporter (DMT)-like permease
MLTFILLFFIIVVGTGGEMCVSKAMRIVGEVHEFHPKVIARFVFGALRVPWMWLGITMMGIAFFSLLTLLSFREVSWVVPMSALSYLAGAIGASLFLREHVTARRWMGIGVICLGVIIVWWSGR